MSKYTTGELAKLCGVSVRTVQYYDTRSILVPSELSEGGRRLYSEEDLERLKIICFLREMDLPINAIGELLAEEDPGSVIGLLLDEQEKTLRAEIGEREKKLDLVTGMKRQLSKIEHFSVESIGDIANLMDNRKKLKKIHGTLLAVGIPAEIVEWGTLIYAIVTGNWWVFVIGLIAVIAAAVWMTRYYFRNVAYICPRCHTVFVPTFRDAFFANHTPTTRKLTCTSCGHHGFCVETCRKETSDEEA